MYFFPPDLTGLLYRIIISLDDIIMRYNRKGGDALGRQKTRGRVRLGPGTLYTLLAKFQDDGLIQETQVEGRRRTYSLTEKGRAAFQEELDRLRACVLDGEEEGR